MINYKILKRIIAIVLCLLLTIFFCINTTSLASSYSDKILNYINKDYTDTTDTSNKINNIVIDIVTIIRIIGICVAVTMLSVVGVKYVTSAPGEKAEIKKSAVVYVTGAFVLFGVVGILGIISKFATAVK